MAQVVWAEPAIQDLDAIADFIALDNPPAARRLVRKVFATIDRLIVFPESGARAAELKHTPYRRLLIKPVFVYFRCEESKIYIVHVVRVERRFDLERIRGHDK